MNRKLTMPLEMNRFRFIRPLFWLAGTLLVGTLLSRDGAMVQAQNLPAKPGTVRVFILAGQSNMQGQGVVDLDAKEEYNGGRGTLLTLMKHPKRGKQFAHLRNEDGTWTQRDDVFIRYQTKDELKTGPLTIGFSGYQGRHHIGPELQFGHVIGNAIEEPVLLIKTAWGGKSLGEDFLPPSAAKLQYTDVGPFYNRMLAEVKLGLSQIKTEFPQLADKKPEIAGFVWQQGWNDLVNPKFRKQYESNLSCLIRDVRKHFKNEKLPFVIGELGNGGKSQDAGMIGIRQAQRNVANRPEFKGNVAFVPTTEYARPKTDSPNVGHVHHWYGNAESYFLIGSALGVAMRGLMDQRDRVLILGDSISLGYTPHVKRRLKKTAYVTRPPTNCEGTTKGLAETDHWLELEGGNWDVIHFNFGLHDLKRVLPGTLKNSNNPEHSNQAPPELYEKQLREIVAKLKNTKAKLIFATTTPVPPGVKPHRDVESPAEYNEIARKIMEENGIAINDLFALVDPLQDELMRPANVHFRPAGSKKMAAQVSNEITKQLKAMKK